MIDWQLLVLRLKRYEKISFIEKYTGMNYQHLMRLSRGEVKEPRFNSGLKLLDCAVEILGEDLSEFIY